MTFPGGLLTSTCISFRSSQHDRTGVLSSYNRCLFIINDNIRSNKICGAPDNPRISEGPDCLGFSSLRNVRVNTTREPIGEIAVVSTVPLGGICREGKARMARLWLSLKIFDSSASGIYRQSTRAHHASLEAQVSWQDLAGRHDYGVLPGFPFAWI